VKPTKPHALSGKKPSKFALEGSKWVIVSPLFLFQKIYHEIGCQEYQENESSLVVENCEIHQTINLFGCKNTTVQVKGKVNAVALGMLPG